MADDRRVVTRQVSSLDKIERRYAWAKRTVGTCEEECKDLFASSWHINEAIFYQFCLWVRCVVKHVSVMWAEELTLQF